MKYWYYWSQYYKLQKKLIENNVIIKLGLKVLIKIYSLFFFYYYYKSVTIPLNV